MTRWARVESTALNGCLMTKQQSANRLASLWAAVAVLALTPPLAAAQGGGTQAPTTVSVSGGAQGASQRLPAGQSRFGLRVPLKPNAESVLDVTATDDDGRTATVKGVRVAQISLTEIVKARVTAERLSTPEIKQLVADGIIDLKNPENYNVSRFVIALVVGGRQISVPVPVVRHKEEPMGVGEAIEIGCAAPGQGLSMTENVISVPCGEGSGGNKNTPPSKIIPFEIEIPGAPGMPSVPGIILIEGRIKTLKEFFRIKLLLMNVSSIFTLTDLTARLELPEGDLTGIAPAGGTIAIPDIGAASEAEGEFIVRGDRKGIHTVTAHFGGRITGAFLEEPLSVLGQRVDRSRGQGPAEDGRQGRASELCHRGRALRPHGHHPQHRRGARRPLHVAAGRRERRRRPHRRGDRGNRARAADARARRHPARRDDRPTLSRDAARHRSHHELRRRRDREHSAERPVRGAGEPGCAIGTLPSEMVDADGKPTVTVVPSHNTVDVPIDPAITAIFSQRMIQETITTGFSEASFNVLGPDNAIVPGTLIFTELFEATAVVFRPIDVLLPATEYTIVVTAVDLQRGGHRARIGDGRPLYNGTWRRA